MRSRALCPFLFLAALLPLAACSGGGGGSGGGGAASLSLLIDTAVDGQTTLAGRFEAVALERSDGALTTNLLAAPADLVLADTVGAPVLLRLQAPPAATYVALHLLLGADVRVTGADGVRNGVVPSRVDQRIALEAPVVVAAATTWFELRHRSQLALQSRNDGRFDWTPDFGCRRGDDRLLGGSSLHIVSVAAAAFSFDATPSLDSSSVTLTVRVPASAILTRSDGAGTLDRATFFGLLALGREVRVQGQMSSSMEITATAVHLDDTSSGSGENKVIGRIGSLDGGTRSLVVQVLRIVRGGAGLDASRLPALTVDATTASIHRSGARHLPLAFSDLAVGQVVELEWRGAVVNNSVRAHEIEIESDAGAGGQIEIEGAVGEVRTGEGAIIAVPRGDDPLIVGGVSVNSARILISASTVLFRADDASVPITLAQVQPGERIWVKSYTLNGIDVAARVVRIRSR